MAGHSPFSSGQTISATIYKSLPLSNPPMLHLPPDKHMRAVASSTMARAARPNAIAPEPAAAATNSSRGAEAGHHHDQERPAVLTVWRKSLLLSCSGFTVFDASGALAFRVDSYDGARRGLRQRWRAGATEVVLMDVAGTPLLTVRRRRSGLVTSLGLAPDRWLIFHGDAANDAGCRRRPSSSKAAKPFLSVRRARRALLGAGASSGKAPLAYVTPLHPASAEAYVVEGSYGARACAVRDARGDAVAEVRPKEQVGDDVFRLVAAPRLGAPLAMALVIALDDMFAAASAGSGSSAPRRPSLLRRTWSA